MVATTPNKNSKNNKAGLAVLGRPSVFREGRFSWVLLIRYLPEISRYFTVFVIAER
jgi:hypothetical protein